MDEYENLSHTKWECKYHVIFIHSEVPTEGAVRKVEAASWRSASGTGRAERVRKCLI
jgi:hypothetical protein